MSLGAAAQLVMPMPPMHYNPNKGAPWRSWSRHRSGSSATRVRFPGSVEHWQCSIVAVNSLSSSCPPPKVQFRLSLIKELVHFVEKGSRR